MLKLDAEFEDLSIDASIVYVHQHNIEAKNGYSSEIGHSRGRAIVKIYVIVDSYSYPLYLRISEEQRGEMKCAILVLKPISLKNPVLADRDYNSKHFMYYIKKRVITISFHQKRMRKSNENAIGIVIKEDIL